MPLSKVLKLSGDKIATWYKNSLSDFSSNKNQKNFDTEDISEKETIYKKRKTIDIKKTIKKNRGKEANKCKKYYKISIETIIKNRKIRVPILKIENFGPRMCIDDKNLGDYGFTIISNLDSGKIAVMIESRKSKIITEVLSNHVSRKILNSVKIMTKDLAYGYERVRKDNFWNAISVADKFHVIKLGNQSISDLRVKYRQLELTKERDRKESHKCREAEKREHAKKIGEKYKTRNCPLAKRYSNGETLLQILASSNRALSQFKEKWGKNMRKRIEILFKEFPEIKEIYKYISIFRGIYNAKDFGKKTLEKAKDSILKWIKQAGASPISELQNFASTVNEHKNNILSYFLTGDTNAYAESLISDILNLNISSAKNNPTETLT